MATRRTRITDVAAHVGMSVATVSLALNNKGRVDPVTRERIKRAARDLGYRPSASARRLRGGRTGTVALITSVPAPIVASTSNLGFLMDMAVPIARHLLEHGHALLLAPPLTGTDHLHLLEVDAAIVIDPVASDPVCAALRERGVAVVTVGRADAMAADGVVDRADGGADVVLAHLAERGARKVGVIVSAEGHSVTSAVRNRLASPTPVSTLLVEASAEGGEDSGYATARSLLESDTDVDAVYAPFDAFAVGAVRAGHDLARHIPDDLMVATNYDGRRAAVSDPPLTALDLGLETIATTAADLVLHCLDSSSAEGELVRPAPEPRVVVRRSTDRRRS